MFLCSKDRISCPLLRFGKSQASSMAECHSHIVSHVLDVNASPWSKLNGEFTFERQGDFGFSSGSIDCVCIPGSVRSLSMNRRL
jgi:hypothetical protein